MNNNRFIITPTTTWQSVPEALDALKTAFQMGCPLAFTLRRLYEAVSEAAEAERMTGVVFMIQIRDGAVEMPWQAAMRLWHFGCQLNVRGMSQARRDLESVGCDPETPEERQARLEQHEAYEAEKERKRLAREAAKSPQPVPEPALKPSEGPARVMSCEELCGLKDMPDSIKKRQMYVDIAARKLLPPPMEEVIAYNKRMEDMRSRDDNEPSMEEQLAEGTAAILDLEEKRRKRRERKQRKRARTAAAKREQTATVEDTQVTT